MLIQRIITGIIGMLATIAVVMYGSWAFVCAITLLAVIAFYEYGKVFNHIDVSIWRTIGFILIPLIMGCAWLGNANETIGLLLAGVLIIFARVVFAHVRFSIPSAAITISGIFYVGLTFSHLILLRFAYTDIVISTALGDIAAGAAFIWLAFVGTWASDTFAYFVGCSIGKHKLCPSISPGKTIEGFLGGLIGTVLALVGLGMLFHFSPYHMVFLGVLLASVATIGDLVESCIKRFTGVKDSGDILPGHGGVLDRFDSIMFTVPLVYYYVHIFSIFNQ